MEMKKGKREEVNFRIMDKSKSNAKVLKVEPPPDYPPEEGCYLLGNPYSPVFKQRQYVPLTAT